MRKLKLSTSEESIDKYPTKPIFICLLLLLGFANGVSAAIGSLQILIGWQAISIAICVQFLLLVLLFGAAKHSFVRRTFAIICLAIICIYLSFFAYYGLLTNEFKEQVEYTRALQAHQTLVAEVYEPLDRQVKALDSEIAQLQEMLAREISDNAGLAGYGPVARQYKMEIDSKITKYQHLKELHEKVSPAFQYDTSQLSPVDIFNRDSRALLMMPDGLSREYNLTLDDYISLQKPDSVAMVPYIRIITPESRDPAAVVALALSSLPILVEILIGYLLVNRRKTRLSMFSFVDRLYSQKKATLVEAYLSKIERNSYISVVFLLAALITHLLFSFFTKGKIQNETIAAFISLSAVIYLRFFFIRYRIRCGFYGTNYYEAKEILSFLKEDINQGGMPPHGGRRVFPEAIPSSFGGLTPGKGEEGAVTWK